MNEILHSIHRVFRLIQCKAKNFQYAHKKKSRYFRIRIFKFEGLRD